MAGKSITAAQAKQKQLDATWVNGMQAAAAKIQAEFGDGSEWIQTKEKDISVNQVEPSDMADTMWSALQSQLQGEGADVGDYATSFSNDGD